MKMFLYIYMILMTMNCFVVCMNNTVIKSIESFYNVQPGTFTRRSIPVMGAGISYPERQNRKERRARGQRKKELTTEEKVQILSGKIDEKIVGGYSNFLSYYLNRGSTLMRLNSASPETLIQELAKIDRDVQRIEGRRLIKVLEEKDSVFRLLVNRLVLYSKNQEIKGSTIDGLFFEDCAFPALPHALGSYIGEKVKNGVLKKYLQLKKHTYDPTIPDIHIVPLLGHRYPIDGSTIKMMRWENFIKAKDIMGNTIYWDTKTGERCDKNRNIRRHIWLETVSEDCWLSKEEYAQKESKKFGIIYQIFTNTDVKRGFEIASVNGFQDVKTTALYLYKEPDFDSWLCHMALLNSMNNNTELDALLQSRFLEKSYLPLTFLKNNVRRLAQKAKETNGAK